MGLILDSSIIISAERRGQTVAQMVEKIIAATGDQDAALSAIALQSLSTAFIAHRRPPNAFAERLFWMNCSPI